MTTRAVPRRRIGYDAVLFDLLTALLDSWTLWDAVAGSAEAGRRWRAAYLKLTYGCGAYRPYETLVREAAEETGLSACHAQARADQLRDRWDELQPWDDVADFLAPLAGRVPLGVVNNCSEVMGRRAGARIGVKFDVIVTAERAGYYKPDPHPYRLALAELELPPERVLFVAGSGFDLIGTAAVGMTTLWHNRAGLAKPPHCSPRASSGSSGCFSASRSGATTPTNSSRSRGGGSGAIQRELARLERAGLVTTRRVGSQKHFQANAESLLFDELTSIARKTFGLALPLHEALAPLGKRIVAAFVYGSVAKRSDTARSDIDLMVISDKLTYASVYAVLKPLHKRLGRQVNPTLYSRKELARRVKSDSSFMKRVLDQPKIWIIGAEGALAA